eukprot:CAMPEP_0198151098 /NCGR_PEP_ID=MMETSP1443-20131203/54207_1 /TAXON_ID=186043 /ORGANISM="Entomoneis sp., Strain CCMP2396" /LENGTH=562 /DNA_ID=CAMNT_0043816655 /DNA_START=21 /DNA_END=1706 /DNA_ORIENTATION=-
MMLTKSILSSFILLFLQRTTAVAQSDPSVEETTCSVESCDDANNNDDKDSYLHDLLKRVHTHEFYINGTWVKSRSIDNETLTLFDPSTAKSFATIAAGNAKDVDFAVRAAHEALPAWSLHTTPQQRKVHVESLLEAFQELQEEMAFLISREMGAPIEMALSSQVAAGLYHIEGFLEVIDEFEFVRPLPNIHADVSEAATTILMDPVGVVAAITPWNWPLYQITAKVISALLVGCTVVLKPSEITPLSALLFAEAMHNAKFPPGVFNLVNGEGSVVGQELSLHPLVNMVSFTGSARVGALVSRAAADTFKRVLLELGGKGATIIFDDVGEEWAEEILAEIDFSNSGQTCNYASRWLVQRSLYERAISSAKQAAEATRVDSAHLPGHGHIGPVSSMVQYERIQALLQAGIEQGATVVTGGLGRPDHLKDSPGAFVRPTIFADCTPDMRIYQEELFGPVICFTPFDTEEEAIALANNSPYGLTNFAFSSSGPRRRRLAHALQSGQVEMNDEPGDLGSPFGGVKASGFGREGGVYGLEEFCQIKAVTGYNDNEEDIEEEDEEEWAV